LFDRRREKEGAQVVAEIKKLGGEAAFVRADVAKDADVKAMVDFTVDKYGRLDIAFNNAGVEWKGPLEQATEGNIAAFSTSMSGACSIRCATKFLSCSRTGAVPSSTLQRRGLLVGPASERLHRVEARGRRPDQIRRARIRQTEHSHQRVAPGRLPPRCGTALPETLGDQITSLIPLLESVPPRKLPQRFCISRLTPQNLPRAHRWSSTEVSLPDEDVIPNRNSEDSKFVFK
jgi:hypothetical protein